MYAVRLWSVRHARGLNGFYRGFESLLLRLSGVFRALGFERVERFRRYLFQITRARIEQRGKVRL